MTPEQQYEQFVCASGGDRCIRSILVANNGMAAAKFCMSIRNWLFERFGDSSLIRIVSMATAEDIKANAMHLHHADSFVEVPGGANFNNYANVSVIVRLALDNRVDAVWPGWGHASENPALPRALEKNGMVFIGPTDRAMFLLGDKIASTIIAESAGVPCVSWSGTGVRVQPDADGRVDVPEDKFAEACVNSAEEAVRVAERVGYPIMIKASEGGGGKGVRMATKAEQIAPMYQAVVDEVKGSPVFLMRLCTGARHIEIQLLSDKKGNVAVLSGRDCSMQRRFQKIVEEGPPRAVAPETLDKMERAAAALARMVGYTHAGTVEYLFLQETQEFFFLELNPRLQVEHPVTEGITGTNLPALQLIVASGIDLSRLPAEDSVSRFLSTPDAPYTNPFDKVSGHVIATRITAENAADGWKPTVGKIEELSFQSLPSVWGYFSVRTPAEVHQFADSQFGHVFAHGKTRQAAQRLLTLAVNRIRCVGEIHSNVKYVAELIGTDDFKQGRITTSWLDSIIAENKSLSPPPATSVAICGALLRAHMAIGKTEAKIKKEYLWRNACPPPELLTQLVETRVEFIVGQTKFEFEVFRHSPEIFTLSANGQLTAVKLKATPGGNMVATHGGRTDTFHYAEEPGDRLRMVLNGATVMVEKEKDPSVLVAPYGGKLTRYLVEEGAHLKKGDPFAEMEVMKMLFALPTAEAGVVSLLKPPNVFVEAGEHIARLLLDDPTLVAVATPFTQPLGDIEPPPEMRESNIALHQQVAYLVARTHHMLDGFVDNEDDVLHKLSELLLDPEVMWSEFDELMAGPGSKLPEKPRLALAALLTPGRRASPHGSEGFGEAVSATLAAFVATLDDGSAAAAFKAASEPVTAFADKYKTGMLDMSTMVTASFLEHFLEVESVYPDDRSEIVGVLHLNESLNDPAKVLQATLSHQQLERKVSLTLNVLDFLGNFTFMNSRVFELLRRLSSLSSTKHLRVQRKAKQIISNCRDNIAEANKELVLPELKRMAAGELSDEGELAVVSRLAAQLKLCQPKLLSMIATSDKALKRAIIRASVMLWYKQGGMSNVSFKTYLRKGKEKSAVTWEYTSDAGEPRFGILLAFQTTDDLEANFDDLCRLALEEKRAKEGSAPASFNKPMSRNASAQALKELAASPSPAFPGTAEVCLHVLVLGEYKPLDADTKRGLPHKSFRRSYAYAVMDEMSTAKMYAKLVSAKAGFLRANSVESVTVMLPHSTVSDNLNYVSIYNFIAAQAYDEHTITRHILPPEATMLELGRLSNFHVERCWFPDAPHTHVYFASAKQQALDTRLFVRALHQRAPALEHDDAIESLASLCTSEMAVALATLEQAIGDSRYQITESNHLFFRSASPLCLSLDDAIRTVRGILPQYQAAFAALKATELELVLPLWDPATPKAALDATQPTIARVICRLGPSVTIDTYEEVCRADGSLGLLQVRPAKGPRQAPDAGPPVALEPYPLLSVVDQKRLRCQKLSTTYCYDFIHLFEIAVAAAWDKAAAADPAVAVPVDKLAATELTLSADGSRMRPLDALCKRGTNKVGMVAWSITMHTPEVPSGRTIIVIANDITFAQGTFGPMEDLVFERASQYARELGVPRIYMAANAGARFGLSDAVKRCFRVQWVGGDDASKGVSYLWLTDKDKEALGDAVVTEVVEAPAVDIEDEDEAEEPPVRTHNKIVAIIGTEDGLGVESLQGAGAIAAETSIANRQIFTLSYCTARNIGIGSYVLRLGQRVIQQRDAPIILTGYMALNKLLGTTVYESNLQLGGPEVMGGNGVSHLLVNDDLEAVHKIVQWLGFVPPKVGAPLPILRPTDPIVRAVDFLPVKGIPYDPRALLTGGVQDGAFRHGLLDHGSFVETLADWAKTVVVGRGRLGGMPVGCIVTENRLVEKAILADPANLESKPQVQMQAGQVWFPDSAYKTAQAIQDFNAGEGLPLLILANWRGFSGGRKDMFEEVLKFGSFIVDQLTQFRQPISVYIPPFCEIRGGAWVVIDSKINPAFMEMYASESARGGVLEPAGIAEIKFRKPDVLKAMTRIDKQLHWMTMNEATGVVRAEDIEQRKTELLPYYQPLGELISDLHDRPERMLAKGVIRCIVPWATSRSFFYWRMRRRVREEELVRALQAAAPLTHDEALAQLHEQMPADVLADDQRCLERLNEMSA